MSTPKLRLEGTLDCQLPRCGDNVIDPGHNEVCEANNLAGLTCQELGFASGDLACAADCRSFDLSGCRPPQGQQCAGPPNFEICAEIWVLHGQLSLQEPTDIIECLPIVPFTRSAQILRAPPRPLEGLSCSSVANITTSGPGPLPPTTVGGYVGPNIACLGVILRDALPPSTLLSFAFEGTVQGNMINGFAQGSAIVCDYAGPVQIQRAPSALPQ